ncbi:hypothetical protein AC249_AIPGENE1692 [Exaiptasia diaphana]|nr:hypothetical protein AC249_AIPGENE1692 [Exaiptasia diaphana]
MVLRSHLEWFIVISKKEKAVLEPRIHSCTKMASLKTISSTAKKHKAFVKIGSFHNLRTEEEKKAQERRELQGREELKKRLVEEKKRKEEKMKIKKAVFFVLLSLRFGGYFVDVLRVASPVMFLHDTFYFVDLITDARGISYVSIYPVQCLLEKVEQSIKNTNTDMQTRHTNLNFNQNTLQVSMNHRSQVSYLSKRRQTNFIRLTSLGKNKGHSLTVHLVKERR